MIPTSSERTTVKLLRTFINTVTYRTDLTDRRDALTVEQLPRGRQRFGHPDMPAWADARRRRTVLNGLDAADAAMLDQATWDLLMDVASQIDRERAAASRSSWTAPAERRPAARKEIVYGSVEAA